MEYFECIEVEEAEEKPQRHFVATQYTPKNLSIGWFCQYKVLDLLETDTGHSSIVYLAEYFYARKEYIRAFDVCVEFQSLSGTIKSADEVAELKARCFAKIKSLSKEQIVEFLSSKECSLVSSCSKVRLYVIMHMFQGTLAP